MTNFKKVLTSALPYANGDLHIGHLYEWLLVDAFKRYQSLFNTPVPWICGDDTHGTAITIKALKLGVSEAQLINDIYVERKQFIQKHNLLADDYQHTHIDGHKNIVQEWYAKCKSENCIIEKKSKQFFDEKLQIFLNDRQVTGTCPHCDAVNQYGDACEKCGKSYEQVDLINPISVETGLIPLIKEIELSYFDVSQFLPTIKNNLSNLPPHLLNKIKHDLDSIPKLWCIGRAGKYFGIPVPGREESFYVWFDAPIAYYSFYKLLNCKDIPIFTHIIGVDILYFHTVFWQALLLSQGLPVPEKILVHGFIVDKEGEKFSKSKGNAPDIKQLINEVGLDPIRLYLLSKANGTTESISFSIEALKEHDNTFSNQFINLYQRVLGIASKNEVVQDIIDNTSYQDVIDSEFYQDLLNKIKNDVADINYKSVFLDIQKHAISLNYFLQSHFLWKDAAQKTDLWKELWLKYVALLLLVEPLYPVKLKNSVEKIKNNKKLFKDDLKFAILG